MPGRSCDYLDRLGTDHDPTVDGRVHAAATAAVTAAPRGGAGRRSCRTGRRPVGAGSRRRASVGSPVVEKRCALCRIRVPRAGQSVAVDGGRGLPATGGVSRRGRPLRAGVRCGRVPHRCRTCRAAVSRAGHAPRFRARNSPMRSAWPRNGILRRAAAITIGHSLGEIGAAYVAEKIPLADADRWSVPARPWSAG